MQNKRAKLSGRTKTPASGRAADFRLRLLESVSDGLILIEGTRRYPRVAVGQGLEGLKRVLEDEERRRAVSCLRDQRRRGYVEVKKTGGRVALVLTEKGEMMRLKLKLKASPKRIDGKTLIIVFDIPERVARVRRILRQFLRSTGFTRLQDSVWALERHGESEITKLLERMNASKWVRCFLSEEIGESARK
jgi:hypothetical protein